MPDRLGIFTAVRAGNRHDVSGWNVTKRRTSRRHVPPLAPVVYKATSRLPPSPQGSPVMWFLVWYFFVQRFVIDHPVPDATVTVPLIRIRTYTADPSQDRLGPL